MDFSHRRVSSTDNVWYVSLNNLEQILLFLMEYQQKAQKTTLKMKSSTKIMRTWKILKTSKKTISDWNVLTKLLITVDLSLQRLSSTGNVRYVSENNLQQILLSLVGYQQKAQRLFSSWIWLFSKIACAIFHTKCEIKYDFVYFIVHSIQ